MLLVEPWLTPDVWRPGPAARSRCERRGPRPRSRHDSPACEGRISTTDMHYTARDGPTASSSGTNGTSSTSSPNEEMRSALDGNRARRRARPGGANPAAGSGSGRVRSGAPTREAPAPSRQAPTRRPRSTERRSRRSAGRAQHRRERRAEPRLPPQQAAQQRRATTRRRRAPPSRPVSTPSSV